MNLVVCIEMRLKGEKYRTSHGTLWDTTLTYLSLLHLIYHIGCFREVKKNYQSLKLGLMRAKYQLHDTNHWRKLFAFMQAFIWIQIIDLILFLIFTAVLTFTEVKFSFSGVLCLPSKPTHHHEARTFMLGRLWIKKY